MPGPLDIADIWPVPVPAAPLVRARMDAHAGELMGQAARACREQDPSRPEDPGYAAYVALQAALAGACLSRADLVAAASLLVVDTVLAVGATDRRGDDLVVNPEHCAQTLELIARNAREALQARLQRRHPLIALAGVAH